jgi:hypothetical protein
VEVNPLPYWTNSSAMMMNVKDAGEVIPVTPSKISLSGIISKRCELLY